MGFVYNLLVNNIDFRSAVVYRVTLNIVIRYSNPNITANLHPTYVRTNIREGTFCEIKHIFNDTLSFPKTRLRRVRFDIEARLCVQTRVNTTTTALELHASV